MPKLATYKGAIHSFCTTAQNNDLLQAGFVALTYVVIENVQMLSDTGTEDSMKSYDTLNDAVMQKQKTIADGGSANLRMARVPAAAGQVALRTASKTTDAFAFKSVLLDGSTFYNRALIMRKPRPGGQNEDFVEDVYTLEMVQEEIIV